MSYESPPEAPPALPPTGARKAFASARREALQSQGPITIERVHANQMTMHPQYRLGQVSLDAPAGWLIHTVPPVPAYVLAAEDTLTFEFEQDVQTRVDEATLLRWKDEMLKYWNEAHPATPNASSANIAFTERAFPSRFFCTDPVGVSSPSILDLGGTPFWIFAESPKEGMVIPFVGEPPMEPEAVVAAWDWYREIKGAQQTQLPVVTFTAHGGMRVG